MGVKRHNGERKSGNTKAKGGARVSRGSQSDFFAELILPMTLAAIPPKAAAHPRAERKQQRRERAKGQPVRIPVLRDAIRARRVADPVAYDAEEDHVEHPRDERHDEGERCGERHEYRPHAVVCRAT